MPWTNGDHAKDVKIQRTHERERCAKVADEIGSQVGEGEGEFYIARKIADAIRKLTD